MGNHLMPTDKKNKNSNKNSKKPSAKILGTGGARKAAEALKKRNKKLKSI